MNLCMKVGTRIRFLAAALGALAFSQVVMADRHHKIGVHVVKTLRVGNTIEDITYIAAGRHRGHVAALNGWDVMAVKVDDDDDRDDWAFDRRRSGESSRA